MDDLKGLSQPNDSVILFGLTFVKLIFSVGQKSGCTCTSTCRKCRVKDENIHDFMQLYNLDLAHVWQEACFCRDEMNIMRSSEN